MTEVILLLAPIFAIMAIGRAALWAKFFDAPAVRALQNFALYAALPALLFKSVTETAALRVIDVAGLYLAGCMLVFVGALAIGRFALQLRLADAAAFALNSTYGNVIYLGTPIIGAAFGPAGIALLVAIIALHSGILLPLAALLIEVGNQATGDPKAVLRSTLKNLIRNPIIMSITAALLWHWLDVPVPTPLKSMLSLLGGAASPLALFCVGASLPAVRTQSFGFDAFIPAMVKLLALPAVIGLLGFASGLSGLALAVALVTAAMPTGANAFLASRRAEGFVSASAATVVITTILSAGWLSYLILRLH
jgi:malonate transporter and related proteins